MSAVATTYPTVAIASDVGIEAAAEFDRFLASFTGKGMVEAPDHQIWTARAHSCPSADSPAARFSRGSAMATRLPLR